MSSRAPHIDEELSDRELDVEELIVDHAYSNEAISKNLQIDIETTKRHVNSLYKKHGVHSRLELAVKVWRGRQVDTPQEIALVPNVLQPKEFQVCQLFAEKLSYKEISEKLDISKSTLSQTVWRICRKIKVKRKKGIIAWFNSTYPTPASQRLGYITACLAFVESWNSSRKKARIENKQNKNWLVTRPVKVFKIKQQINLDKLKPEDTLTVKEFKLLELLASGKSRLDIASELKLTKGTVNNYLKAVYLKLGVESQLQASAWFNSRYPTDEAIKNGYVLACSVAKKRKQEKRDESRLLRTLGK